MAVTLNYVSLDTFDDVFRLSQQAEASDDDIGPNPNKQAIRDKEMVKRFLKRAESRAESYLTGYDRPLDSTPPALEYAIYVIARYMLLERGDGSVSEDVQASYDQEMDWLMDVKMGEADLNPSAEENLTDFVGEADLGQLKFETYPHVDKSTYMTGDPI